MKKQIISIITAGAIATAGMSVPAQANQNEDLMKFLFGAIVLGAIAQQANSNSQVTVTSNQHHKPKAKAKPKKKQHRHGNNRHYEERKKPKQCLRQRWTRDGWKKYYDVKCMTVRGWHRHNKRSPWHFHAFLVQRHR